MGAWGEGVFENDAAGDWTDQLDRRAKPYVVAKAVRKAVGKRRGYLESDDAAVALAAAEVAAASRGRPCRELPEEVNEWLDETGWTADAECVQLSITAVERVRDDSELADLWEDDASWKRGLSSLLRRLRAEPRRTAKKKAAKRPGFIGALKKKGISFVRDGRTITEAYGGRHQLADSDMSLFGNLPDLTEIRLSTTKVTDAGVVHLAHLTKLKYIELCENAITDKSSDVFANMPDVEHLELSDTGVGDETAKRIGRMKKLQDLRLENTKITDRGLSYLTDCQQLKRLDLEGTAISTRGLKSIGELKALLVLSLKGTSVTSFGLKHLLNLTKIRNLDLADTKVDNSGCRTLAQIKSLNTLRLDNTGVTSSGLKQIEPLKNLSSLDVTGLPVTDDDIPSLLSFSKLKLLAIFDTQITHAGQVRLMEALVPTGTVLGDH